MTPESPQPTSGPGKSGRFADEEPPADRPSAAFKEAVNLAAEVKEYAAYFVAAKIDGYKALARNLGIYAALGVLGAAVGVTVMVVSVVLLLTGLSAGLSALAVHLLGVSWFWLGPVVLGILILGSVAVGALLGMRWINGTLRTKTVAKYEDRKRRQRGTFGRNVSEHAGR